MRRRSSNQFMYFTDLYLFAELYNFDNSIIVINTENKIIIIIYNVQTIFIPR